VVELIVDGSFVTGKPDPSDVDLVVVLAGTHDLTRDLRPYEYNVVSKRRVRQAYRFDILVVLAGSRACAEYAEFFQQVRGQPQRRKGILRVKL
jgi:predicted nucleotidyltransferase